MVSKHTQESREALFQWRQARLVERRKMRQEEAPARHEARPPAAASPPTRKPRHRPNKMFDHDELHGHDSTGLVAIIPEETFNREFDQLAARVITAPTLDQLFKPAPRPEPPKPVLVPELSHWRSVLRREPTNEELSWLCRWKLTKAGNRMIVGYLQVGEAPAVDVRVVVCKANSYQREPYYYACLYMPADSERPDPDAKRTQFPNSAEAMLFIHREFHQSGCKFTTERPGKLLNLVTERVVEAVTAEEQKIRAANHEILAKARGFDL